MAGYHSSGMMTGFKSGGMTKDEWVMSNPTVIDYNHRHPSSYESRELPPTNVEKEKYEALLKLHEALTTSNQYQSEKPTTTGNSWGSASSSQDAVAFTKKFNPFVEDNLEDMEISDEESSSQNKPEKVVAPTIKKSGVPESPVRLNIEVTSGSAFYKGLILFIPPFEQLSNNYKNSPAMKMLYASFEFSFKKPIKIETKQRENDPKTMDATVFFKGNVLSTGCGSAPHIEASVRALELLSETCYTIQAKEDYFQKCKLINADNMKTLNLKKWEAVSQKYPKLLEITKDSHIKKTFAVFLDNHTSSGEYEDIVCCNLTRQDVNNVKTIVEFFYLTMLPCSVSTNLSKKDSPCVITIHKYTSAQKLMEILVECGGENDKFTLYPPDTFKDFYKLHQNYWDPILKKNGEDELKTTLEDEELQAVILKPYENTISELFEKHKSQPKVKSSEDNSLRKAGDDFMKETLKIDVAHSKNVAPVERMQLLLKYMEQLQEYGSRVLTTGRPEMIKIYHNAIENLRKDLETCRKDIEKEQNSKSSTDKSRRRSSSTDKSRRRSSPRRRSPVSRRTPPWRRSPTQRRSKSPGKQSLHSNSKNKSVSPKRRPKSRSPKRPDRPRKSLSPRRRPRSKSPRTATSPRRKPRSKSPRTAISPRRRKSRSPRSRQTRSPPRRNPPRTISSSTSHSNLMRPLTGPSTAEKDHIISIFKDQFRRYVEILRRFRIEIEDTPIERRHTLKEKLAKCRDQYNKFLKETKENRPGLKEFLIELDICKEELNDQAELIAGKPAPSDLPRNITPPPWMNVRSYEPEVAYPLPATRPFPHIPHLSRNPWY